MFEHDVGILADQRAHLLAEPAPLALILRVLVRPELVSLGSAVDHVLTAHRLEQLHPVIARDDAHGCSTTVEHQLDRVGADAAGRSPDEHVVALLHLRSVPTDQHAVAGGRTQGVDGRLLPGEMGGLGHQLVRLHDRQVGQPTEVRLETPDPLVGREHRIVVCRRILVVEVVAVDRDPVAGLPVADRGADPQHHAGGVGADDVEVLRVTLAPDRFLAETVEEVEGRQRLEDRCPDGVEVDRARHGCDEDLIGCQLRRRDVADVQGLGRVLVLGSDAGPHVLLGAQDMGAPVGGGDRDGGDLLA